MPTKPNQSGQQPYDPKTGEYLSKEGGAEGKGQKYKDALETKKAIMLNKIKGADANRGYAGYSISQRAMKAYGEGKMPLSKWNKTTILGAILDILEENGVKDIAIEQFEKMSFQELKKEYLHHTGEWHHTSKHFNKTDFWEIDSEKILEMSNEYKEAVKAHSKSVADKLAANKQLDQEILENPSKRGYIKIPKEMVKHIPSILTINDNSKIRYIRQADDTIGIYVSKEVADETYRGIYKSILETTKKKLDEMAQVEVVDKVKYGKDSRGKPLYYKVKKNMVIPF